MAVTLLAPKGTTAASHAGEQYAVVDGAISVPDAAARELIASHGFMDPRAAHPAAAPTLGKHGETLADPSVFKAAAAQHKANAPANDADLITDDEDKPLASDFSAGLSQNEMKQYLRFHKVAVPKTGTVKDLRTLVEQTWTENEGSEPVSVNDAGEHGSSRTIVEGQHPGFTKPHFNDMAAETKQGSGSTFQGTAPSQVSGEKQAPASEAAKVQPVKTGK